MNIRRYLPGIIVLAAVSLAIIAFASPLFRVLGFEYSSVSAIALSMWVMLASSKRAMSAEPGFLKQVAFETLIYALTPLFISILSLVAIPNCDLVYGLLYYIEIVPATIIIAALLGTLIGRCATNNFWRIAFVIFAWIVWFGVSFIPGYFGPQIFTYGWQYGYFPGFVWDEAMELRDAYWYSRAVEIAIAILSLIVIRPKRSLSRLAVSAFVPVAAATITVLISTFFFQRLGIVVTNDMIERRLSDTIIISPVTIHFSIAAFNADERAYLKYELRADLDSIKAFYKLHSITEPIDIYVYSSSDMMNMFIGTGNASISKPWRSELHIAKENLRSLKHELTHVILASFGKFPFDVSYSTGLTEGAAEASDPYYDGIRSPTELAAEIVQTKLAYDIKSVMSFTGFASSASGKSYVLAGSFASYLIGRFGAEKYLSIYRSLDYDAEYGVPIESLENDWLVLLAKNEKILSHYDSLRIRYDFDRHSIVAEPCVRRIGRLMKQAHGFYQRKHFIEADKIYKQVVDEAGRADAARNRAFCYIQLKDFPKALAALDSSMLQLSAIDRIGLHQIRGDLLYIVRSDKREAVGEWSEAENFALNSEQLLSSLSRRFCFSTTPDTTLAASILAGIYQNESIDVIANELDRLPIPAKDSGSFGAARFYLHARLCESKGKLREAVQFFQKAKKTGGSDLYSKSFNIFQQLMDDRFSDYERALTY
ncbi:MAG TPA: hypothetical protein VEW28_08140 [Candidatus Kapabacteria bacterium]|nr:hypothetical protein [Candidatus Kapabacteria bacterium]